MLKLRYEEPIIKVIEFISEDIIITSNKDNEIEDEWDSGDGFGEFK